MDSGMIIDGMMHLEVMGSHWDGIFEEIVRLYDTAGIDKGVAMTTMRACRTGSSRRSAGTSAGATA